jgi:hypothetical protein
MRSLLTPAVGNLCRVAPCGLVHVFALYHHHQQQQQQQIGSTKPALDVSGGRAEPLCCCHAAAAAAAVVLLIRQHSAVHCRPGQPAASSTVSVDSNEGGMMVCSRFEDVVYDDLALVR